MPTNKTGLTKSLQCALPKNLWMQIRKQNAISEENDTIQTMVPKMAQIGVDFKELADELGVTPEQLLKTVRENAKF